MSEQEIVENTSPKLNRRRLFFWLGIASLVVTLLFLMYWLFRQPSRGIVTSAPAKEKINYAAPEHRKRYDGKYLTFTYPRDFERREEVETVKFPILERLYLSRSDIEGRKIAITVQDNTGYSFEEYSSFRIRRSDSGTYAEEKVSQNGLEAVLFSKSTSVFEVSAFFPSASYIVSIVISSPTTQNGLRAELLALLDSFVWKAPEK